MDCIIDPRQCKLDAFSRFKANWAKKEYSSGSALRIVFWFCEAQEWFLPRNVETTAPGEVAHFRVETTTMPRALQFLCIVFTHRRVCWWCQRLGLRVRFIQLYLWSHLSVLRPKYGGRSKPCKVGVPCHGLLHGGPSPCCLWWQCFLFPSLKQSSCKFPLPEISVLDLPPHQI